MKRRSAALAFWRFAEDADSLLDPLVLRNANQLRTRILEAEGGMR
jgi:hypothetical protein